MRMARFTLLAIEQIEPIKIAEGEKPKLEKSEWACWPLDVESIRGPVPTDNFHGYRPDGDSIVIMTVNKNGQRSTVVLADIDVGECSRKLETAIAPPGGPGQIMRPV